MNPKNTLSNTFIRLECCVIIPTYNNQNTLARVIDGVLEYTNDILLINDGSTDNTPQILSNYQGLEIITFQENKGKGEALKAGFKKANSLGYKYAITIDSDGQHYPNDFPVFLSELEKQDKKEPLLLIGSRKMDDPTVPGKSSFGNKFSNFWYYVETGIKLTDTQSGFRLYPLEEVSKLKLYTTKFELEIEVIVKLAWNQVTVRNVPIKVLYDENERVTHFRPFRDFTRISILNTWLVILTLLYYAPRNRYYKFKKKGFKRYWKENVLKSDDSPSRKSTAIMLGLFIGIIPLWGFQTVAVFAIAASLRLNKVIAFLFSNISIPPMIPFIVYASCHIGAFVLGRDLDITLNIDKISNGKDVLEGLGAYVLGSFILATITSLLFGGVSYLYFKNKNNRN